MTAFAQTKKETELWIKNTIEAHPSRSLFRIDYTVSYDQNRGEMWISEWWSGNDPHNVVYIIPIKHMKSPKIESTHSGVRYEIRIKPVFVDNKLIDGIIKVTKDKESDKYNEEKGISSYFLDLNKSLMEDNRHERLITAINHLIELYGGEIDKIDDDLF